MSMSCRYTRLGHPGIILAALALLCGLLGALLLLALALGVWL